MTWTTPPPERHGEHCPAKNRSDEPGSVAELVNFGIQNMIVYGCQFALQVGRILREEKLLSGDESYCAYRGKVRFRVIPGVF